MNNIQKWLEFAKKAKGTITFPENADEQIESIIIKHGAYLSVERFEQYIDQFEIGKDFEQRIKDGEFENQEESVEGLFQDCPESIVWMNDYLPCLSDFDFAQRVYTANIPLQEQLADIKTPNDVMEMAEKEVAWVFYAVYMIANHIIPIFEKP